MSKNEQSPGPRDVFSVYQQSFDKFFNAIRQSVPQYYQSVTNVQQEQLQACESFVSSAIGMQKDLAKKSGIGAVMPEAAVKMVREYADELAKASGIQNRVVLASIDAAQQNIKAFNGNAKSFADLNKSIVQSWISAFTPRGN